MTLTKRVFADKKQQIKSVLIRQIRVICVPFKAPPYSQALPTRQTVRMLHNPNQ